MGDCSGALGVASMGLKPDSPCGLDHIAFKPSSQKELSTYLKDDYKHQIFRSEAKLIQSKPVGNVAGDYFC